ncbi:phosphate acetyltransferase [Bacilli bacterium PM5-3]|nr:phosphate acetyltransferase [Bacilli bacterium PM5-3]MDH6603385.1 phosphate acetyltransferase [Bacilli bacterium PM5-9]
MLLDKMKENIKGKKIRIVLTEGEDERVLGAAVELANDDLVLPVLVGNVGNIEAVAKKNNWSLDKCELIDVASYDKREEMAATMTELRKGKQTKEECAKMLESTNYFGTMLVKMGLADGLVGGATYSTADTVRPALQLIKTKPQNKTVSSSFVIYDETQRYIMGDCAIIVDPSDDELCEIAVESANTARVFDIDPKVAFLSYSTKGSGKGAAVDKVVSAVNKMQELDVDFEYDGEFQFDAAFVESVGKLKAPESKVAGQANVFVFPNLECGNIGYKIAQRLGKLNALGPILQGLNAPINDLSRGCSKQDVYELCIVTAAQHLMV